MKWKAGEMVRAGDKLGVILQCKPWGLVILLTSGATIRISAAFVEKA